MKEVVITADKIKKRKKFYKRTKLIVFIILLILIFSFIILSIVYNGGRFTVTLDNNFALKSGIILYETEEFQNDQTRKLYAENIDFLDNISIDSILSFNVIFNVAVKACPFVALSTSLSVYVTVKFCSATLVLLYPVTILSARTTGVFVPAFAYVTAYVILLSFINFDNSSLYSPVITLGVTVISVT